MPQQRLVILVLLCAAILAGCSKSTKVSSVRHEAKPAAAPFSKIVVVGVTPNQNLRVSWERVMAETLDDAGNTVWTSFRELDYEIPTRENITEVVRATGADAVLVSRLIRQEVSAEDVDERTGAKKRRKNQYVFDIFRYDYEEFTEPSYTLVASDVELATDLYETTEGRLIYSIDSTTFQKQTAWDVLDEATIAIAKKLRSDRMTR